MRKLTKIVGLGAAVAIAGTIGWNALADEPGNGQGFGPPFMHGMGPGMGMGMGTVACPANSAIPPSASLRSRPNWALRRPRQQRGTAMPRPWRTPRLR